MNQSPDQHTNLGWLQVLPLIVIGVMAIVLWRPAPDPPPTAEQEAKIADLAAQLGSATSTAVTSTIDCAPSGASSLTRRQAARSPRRSLHVQPAGWTRHGARSWHGTFTVLRSSAMTGPR